MRNRLGQALDRILREKVDRKPLLGDAAWHEADYVQRLPHTRVMIMLKGKQRVRISQGGEEQEVLLDRGKALFLSPQGWFSPNYDQDYTIFGMVFRAGCLRLLINDHEARLGHRSPRCWCHLNPPNATTLAHTAEALNTLTERGSPSDAARPLFRALLHLAREALSAPEARQGQGGATGKQTFAAILDYLQVHYQDNIDRNLVAQAFGLHPGHISRLFQQHSTESFNATLNRLRLERAEELLQASTLSVKAIAAQCGFGSAVHFIRRFRRHAGCTPGAFRQA